MDDEKTLNLPLCVADLQQIDGDEPRVLFTRLGQALGYAKPKNVRKLINENEPELLQYGTVFRREVPISGGNGAIQQSEEIWLNEGQALVITELARTKRAQECRFEVNTVFMAWRRGHLQPTVDSPIMFTRGAVQEILGHLGEHGKSIGELKTNVGHLQADVGTLGQKIDNLEKTVKESSPRRKFFTDDSQKQFLYVCWLVNEGKCTCGCGKQIVDELTGEKLPNCVFDHQNGRHRNKVTDGSVLDAECNQELEDKPGERDKRMEHRFPLFHQAREMLFPNGWEDITRYYKRMELSPRDKYINELLRRLTRKSTKVA